MWPEAAIDLWIQQVAETPGDTPRGRKRGLAEMSENVITTPKPKPSKRAKQSTTNVQVHEDENENEPAGDEEYGDPTPIPLPHHPISSVAALPARDNESVSGASTSSAAMSNSSLALSTPSRAKRKRNASPKKELSRGAHAQYPISTRAVDAAKMPEALQPLLMDLRRIALGRRVISRAWEGWQAQLRTPTPEEDEFILDNTTQRASLGDDMPLDDAQELLLQAQLRQDRACSEASWNTFVHGVALSAATRRSPYKSNVSCENITTARVSAVDRTDTKRVDFCLALELDGDLKRELCAANVDSVNHTDYDGVAFSPIAVSIETKAGVLDSGSDADLQLRMWAKYQFDFLRGILIQSGRDPVLPPLPLIVAQGHEWRMYYFVEEGNGAILYRDTSAFGNTDTLLGIFKLHTGLQRLIRWAEEWYRPWFMEHIIPGLLQGSSAAGPSRT
ncbi:Hypothetical predicted protein [Lecanosticta acicola]|uniref:PD-(D/E)XK nuclease-like domain-containing protein n=1 Tax=Lecanosticta acicola TaxID=111012 RepID=A0AAI8Z8G6_9PEZI|nr:Hypothetical predicted protein [Lecanosticta acicola]